MEKSGFEAMLLKDCMSFRAFLEYWIPSIWGTFGPSLSHVEIGWLWTHFITTFPASILRKSTSGRHQPVSYPDGPMTARYRFT